MTFKELLALLKNMEEVGHTALDRPVEGLVEGDFYNLDLYESLTTGNVYFSLLSVSNDDDQA